MDAHQGTSCSASTPSWSTPSYRGCGVCGSNTAATCSRLGVHARPLRGRSTRGACGIQHCSPCRTNMGRHAHVSAVHREPKWRRWERRQVCRMQSLTAGAWGWAGTTASSPHTLHRLRDVHRLEAYHRRTMWWIY